MSDLSFTRGLQGSFAAAAIIVGFGMGSAAEAGICPTTGLSATVSRVMEAEGPGAVPPDQAQCYAYGSGNINGEIDHDPIVNGKSMGGNTFILDANSPINPALVAPDIVFLQKTPTDPATYISFTGVGGTSGTFSILGPIAGYADLIVGLKIGGGGGPGGDAGNEPDWFSWVVPNVAGTYAWGFDSGRGFTGLSHGNLYGQVANAPLPAAAWLILAGIGALGVASRRRKAAEA